MKLKVASGRMVKARGDRGENGRGEGGQTKKVIWWSISRLNITMGHRVEAGSGCNPVRMGLMRKSAYEMTVWAFVHIFDVQHNFGY